MDQKSKHLGIHVDAELHYKLKYLSSYEGRSINGEVLYLVRRAIERFEKENGIIKFPEEQREEETVV